MNIQEWKQAGKPFNVILHGDCMDLMSELGENEIDLAVVDPPYGIGIDGQKGEIKNGVQIRKNHEFKKWDLAIPKKEYFDELFRISKNQIIWGGNYFTEHLKPVKSWVFWYKGQTGLTMSDGEMAWTSTGKVTRMIDLHRTHLWKERPFHPTQKPIALYRWILQNYAKPGQTIIDTHSGSGSLACACHLEKFNFIAIEKDYDYWLASVKRYEELKSQGTLF
jgi:site-specific DNA-methyltransferase (adenine-specific)